MLGFDTRAAFLFAHSDLQRVVEAQEGTQLEAIGIELEHSLSFLLSSDIFTLKRLGVCSSLRVQFCDFMTAVRSRLFPLRRGQDPTTNPRYYQSSSLVCIFKLKWKSRFGVELETY